MKTLICIVSLAVGLGAGYYVLPAERPVVGRAARCSEFCLCADCKCIANECVVVAPKAETKVAADPLAEYWRAVEIAKRLNQPLVVFVNCPARKMKDYVTCQVRGSFNGQNIPHIVAGSHDEHWKFPDSATDVEIFEYLGWKYNWFQGHSQPARRGG